MKCFPRQSFGRLYPVIARSRRFPARVVNHLDHLTSRVGWPSNHLDFFEVRWGDLESPQNFLRWGGVVWNHLEFSWGGVGWFEKRHSNSEVMSRWGAWGGFYTKKETFFDLKNYCMFLLTSFYVKLHKFKASLTLRITLKMGYEEKAPISSHLLQNHLDSRWGGSRTTSRWGEVVWNHLKIFRGEVGW